MKRNQFCLFATVTGLMLSSIQMDAATYDVTFGLAWPGFMPATNTILPGDTVR